MGVGRTTGLLLLGVWGAGCASGKEAEGPSGGREVQVTVSQDPKAWEAWNKAQAEALARAQAQQQAAQHQAAAQQQAAQARAAEEAQKAQQSQAALMRREQELQAAEQAQVAAQQELEQQRRQLEQRERALIEERAARAQAEDETQRALEEVASVREEARGLVATLSGNVLFATNQTTLLPSAQRSLDRVADALVGSKFSPILIEGYTDSIGSNVENAELSQKRAQAVRDYLVDRGVEASRLRAVGYGEQRPVASNQTAEGRAYNRRVEIVLPRSATGGAGGLGLGGGAQEDVSGGP